MKMLFIFFLPLFFISCATDIDFRIPTNRFESPETNGGFLRGEIDLGYESSQRVSLTEIWDYSIFGIDYATEVSDGTYISERQEPVFKLSLGILSRLDLFTRSSYDSPDMYGAKFQFWGTPRLAKQPGLKMAIAASIGSDTWDESNLTATNPDNQNEIEYDSELTVDAYDLSFIMGYRLTPSFLTYLNIYYSNYNADASLTKPDQTTHDYSSDTNTQGALLGIQLGERGIVKLEAGYSKTEDTESGAEDERVSLGASIGLGW